MRSQNSDQRRYYDDDQQRDKGQQYKRFLQGGQQKSEQWRSNEETAGRMRWPEEEGSVKNNDAYRENYQEGHNEDVVASLVRQVAIIVQVTNREEINSAPETGSTRVVSNSNVG